MSRELHLAAAEIGAGVERLSRSASLEAEVGERELRMRRRRIAERIEVGLEVADARGRR